MNNNPELSNNSSSENDANQWDILPKENFYQHQQNSEEAPKSELSDEEIKQILRARKRNEQLKNNVEAKKHANRVAAGLLAFAITATALVGGIVATSQKDILETDRTKQNIIEMENAEEIVFYGNVRSNPEIPNSEDPSNIYTDTDDEIRIDVPEGSTILYYPGDKDPNGGWYGVPVDILESESFISDREARRLEKDHDGYAWINHNNASVTTESENSSF